MLDFGTFMLDFEAFMLGFGAFMLGLGAFMLGFGAFMPGFEGFMLGFGAFKLGFDGCTLLPSVSFVPGEHEFSVGEPATSETFSQAAPSKKCRRGNRLTAVRERRSG